MALSRTASLTTAVLLAIAGAACGDSSGPDPRVVDEDEVVAQCSRATITSATTTQTITGTIDNSDCQVRGDDGLLEGYRLPQTAFGAETELLVEVEAEFDAIIVVTDPDGFILADSDEDIGGDLGHEAYVLPFDLDPAEPEYFIVVYSLGGEDGDYTLRVGPLP